MYRLLLIVPLVLLLLACNQPEPEAVVVTDRVVQEVEVIKEVTVEVPVEVPVEVIREVVVEVPVAPANCPPASEITWLIENMEHARWMHQKWADYFSDFTPEGGSLLADAMGDRDAQLRAVAIYDHRLAVARQLQQVCQ